LTAEGPPRLLATVGAAVGGFVGRLPRASSR
jgi:hypothetical protein